MHNYRLVDPRLSQKFINGLQVKLATGMVFTFIALSLSFQYAIISVGILAFAMMAYLLPPDAPVYIVDGVEVEMTEE